MLPIEELGHSQASLQTFLARGRAHPKSWLDVALDPTPKVCQRIGLVAKKGKFRRRPTVTPPKLRICARYKRHPSMSRGAPLDAILQSATYSSHGLNSGTPKTLRVTSVRSLASAVAAKKPSMTDSATPLRRLCCETIGIPAVSQVGAPLAAILQSARTMQQIMNANVLERRLGINLKCLHQHTAIAALAHGT